jgi:hypothetical protein
MVRIQAAFWAAVLLFLAAIEPAGLAAPATAMPTFAEMDAGRTYWLPCAPADPFVLRAQAFEANPDHRAWDAFLVTYVPYDLQTRALGTPDARPFLALRTDGRERFVYHWLDIDRDGRVDREGPLTVPLADGEDFVCGLARQYPPRRA